MSEHLVKDHPCSPDVTLLGVALFVLAQVDFGTRIERSAHLSCDKNAACFSGQTEVADLDIVLDPDEHVVRLDISVHGPWVILDVPLAFM